MTIIFGNIHIDFIEEPTDELVTIMMILVIELALASPYPSNKALMVNNPAVTFRIQYRFKKFLYFINEVVLLLIKRLPCHNLLPKRLTVVQHLDR